MNSKQIGMIKEDCSKVFTNPDKLSFLKNESILITGGSGFIGSWLSESIAYLNDSHDFGMKLTLLARNMDVITEKQPHLSNRKDIKLINKNICDLVEIPNDTTLIIHAAGTPDNRVHLSNPLEVIKTITNGTVQILEAGIRLSSLKKFLNISSGWVYGSQPGDIVSIPETYNGGPTCFASSSAYAEAKRMGETICSVYRGQYRLPVINLRPFAFIGPYQLIDKPWAINNFINNAINGDPIKIFGDENTVRSYMYPSDMANWILTALCLGESGLTLNLGSSEGISLRKVAEKISDCVPNEATVITQTINRKAKQSFFVPDVSKAKTELELELTVSLDQAVQRTIEWLS